MTKPIKVELIEDDILLARQFVASLQKEGYDVHHSHHAKEAMVIIDELLPDVIILDVLLPVTTGFTLLHELQSYDDTRVIPIIICSSVPLALKEVESYGVRRVVDKTTMLPGDLVKAVRVVLP